MLSSLSFQPPIISQNTRGWSMDFDYPKTSIYDDSSSGETLSWWPNKYKRSMIAIMI
jgi:hypothetical protein